MQPTPSEYQMLQQSALPLNVFIRLGLLIVKKKWQLFLGLYCCLSLPISFMEYIWALQEKHVAVPMLLGVLFQLLFTTFSALIVEAEVRGATLTKSILIAYGSRRFLPALFTLLLFVCILFIATLAFIIPGIALGIFFQFGVFVAITRNQVGMPALRYSMKLVKHQWWYTCAACVMFSIIVPMVIGLPFILILGGDDPSSAKAILMNNLIGGASSIPGNVMLILLFLNLDYQPRQADGSPYAP